MLACSQKKITILGAKRSGQATARLAHHLGARVAVSDSGTPDGVSPSFLEWVKDHAVECEFGSHSKGLIEQSDILVLSPGVSIHSEVASWARAKNIEIFGEVEFASHFCKKPIVAVTGSNGKTTVSTLIHQMLEKAGKKSCLCGNVGQPFADYVLERAVDFFVLEVSSFQMESVHTGGFHPYIAVWLNFSENHLDRHKDLDEYFEAKTKIFLNQTKDDFAVLNQEDQRVASITGRIGAQKRFFSANSKTNNPNYNAVLTVGEILGIDPSVCMGLFKEFKGVEHRLEIVRSVNGVEFINDSKSTTAQATRWALEHIEHPAVLICGGRDKNINFSALTLLVGQKVKKMFVIGEASEKLQKTFNGVVDVQRCDTLEDAVQKSKEYAKEGDRVVLSPMCASFDMFEDYEHRGRVFKEIVNRLK